MKAPFADALLLLALLAGAGSAAGQSATVAGTVWDSVRAVPLAGARVELSGTRSWTLSGEDGTYRIDHPNAGRYRLAFSHPWLDSLGVDVEPRVVALERGEAVFADLAIPSLATVRARLCGADADTALAVVVGRVRGREGEEGIEGIRVVLEWRLYSVDEDTRRVVEVGMTRNTEDAVTGPGGRYHACSVILARHVTVRAGDARRLHPAGSLRLQSPTIHVHDVRLPW